jgi:hypothetical protein
MHFLRDLCECPERRLPELRRRAGAPAAAPAQAGTRSARGQMTRVRGDASRSNS